MNTPRKPLADILPGRNGGDDDIFNQFDATEAADDFGPLPKGVYVVLATGGRLDQARTGTRCYKVEFRVIEGEHAGRRLWWDKYLTPAALPYTKRDLSKLGITSREKLEQPLPANRLVCKVTVVVRTDDDGIERNEIRNLELLRVQDAAVDPFAPKTGNDPSRDSSAEFPFGANGEGQT
ncbi:DUF669 domain-containing protein [Fimbriiglobus ruber]|uniref:DUF669 domain-containing protein n=1 Tax=Fimbriiglobus ruber TaxID=1908690 RepID=A0A225E1W0_9BACT|nr:DUF669 domain-containing protein [Fimbriiglobus ruber]OWK44026.1 hypothetical protein FRUB_03625 [Fimbriiglobus ruber]